MTLASLLTRRPGTSQTRRRKPMSPVPVDKLLKLPANENLDQSRQFCCPSCGTPNPPSYEHETMMGTIELVYHCGFCGITYPVSINEYLMVAGQ